MQLISLVHLRSIMSTEPTLTFLFQKFNKKYTLSKLKQSAILRLLRTESEKKIWSFCDSFLMPQAGLVSMSA